MGQELAARSESGCAFGSAGYVPSLVFRAASKLTRRSVGEQHMQSFEIEGQTDQHQSARRAWDGHAQLSCASPLVDRAPHDQPRIRGADPTPPGCVTGLCASRANSLATPVESLASVSLRRAPHGVHLPGATPAARDHAARERGARGSRHASGIPALACRGAHSIAGSIVHG